MKYENKNILVIKITEFYFAKLAIEIYYRNLFFITIMVCTAKLAFNIEKHSFANKTQFWTLG